MGSNKTNIDISCKKYNQNNKAIFIAFDIEYITIVPYIVRRQIIVFQFVMILPRSFCYLFNLLL